MNADYKPLWDKLRLGYHISPRDGVLYETLYDATKGAEVRELLSKLGYELVQHRGASSIWREKRTNS